jgi:hypothetical protein
MCRGWVWAAGFVTNTVRNLNFRRRFANRGVTEEPEASSRSNLEVSHDSERDGISGSVLSFSVSDHRKTYFLNGRPTGIAVGRREMDQSRDCGDRRSRTGIRSPSEEAPAK